MKKFLSIFMCIALVLSFGVVLSSCGAEKYGIVVQVQGDGSIVTSISSSSVITQDTGKRTYTLYKDDKVTVSVKSGVLDYWLVDDVKQSPSNDYSVTLDKSHTVKAVFKEINYNFEGIYFEFDRKTFAYDEYSIDILNTGVDMKIQGKDITVSVRDTWFYEDWEVFEGFDPSTITTFKDVIDLHNKNIYAQKRILTVVFLDDSGVERSFAKVVYKNAKTREIKNIEINYTNLSLINTNVENLGEVFIFKAGGM